MLLLLDQATTVNEQKLYIICTSVKDFGFKIPSSLGNRDKTLKGSLNIDGKPRRKQADKYWF